MSGTSDKSAVRSSRKRKRENGLKQDVDHASAKRRHFGLSRKVIVKSLEENELAETSDGNITSDFRRMDSGYCSPGADEDESDVITPVNVTSARLDQPPDEVDSGSLWGRFSDQTQIEAELRRYPELTTSGASSMKKRSILKKVLGIKDSFDHPDDKSVVRVVHDHQDSFLGDEFGMTIISYNEKGGYHQHFLTEIMPDSPAGKMQIHEFDELVMLNDVFVPELTHERVVDLFKHLPVDSHTRTVLLLRRLDKTTHQLTWIENSAILIPEYDKEPGIKQFKTENLGAEIVQSHWALLKVSGQPLYLCQGDGIATAEVLKHDKSDLHKEVLISARMAADVLHPRFRASIMFRNNMFLEMNSSTAIPTLMDQEVLYNFDMSGSWASFQLQGPDKRFIGYDLFDQKLTLVEEHYKFEKFPPSGTYDHPDGRCDVICDAIMGSSSRESMRINDSGNSSLETSLSGSDLDFSSSASDLGSLGRSDRKRQSVGYDSGNDDGAMEIPLPRRRHGMVTRQMSAATMINKMCIGHN